MGNKVLLPVHPHFTGINQVYYLYQHPMVSKLSILAGTSLVVFFCGYFFMLRGKHMHATFRYFASIVPVRRLEAAQT